MHRKCFFLISGALLLFKELHFVELTLNIGSFVLLKLLQQRKLFDYYPSPIKRWTTNGEK